MGRPRKNQDDSSDLLGLEETISHGGVGDGSTFSADIVNGFAENIVIKPPQSSPEKLVIDMSRWREIDSSARSGLPYFVSNTGIGDGILAFYRRTRAFANASKRWQHTGKFVDFITGADLVFQPLYFRNRFE